MGSELGHSIFRFLFLMLFFAGIVMFWGFCTASVICRDPRGW